MKKPNLLLAIIIMSILLGTVFISCKSDDDNTDTTISISLKMKTTNTPITRSANNSNSLVFNSGSVTIREIVFDGYRALEDSVSITHEQISTINLETGVASPPVNVIIPPGEYTSVNLGIELQDVNDLPTVIAEGVYTDAEGIETPLKFEFNSGEVFEAEAVAHTFESGTSAIAEIDFSPAIWFSTVTGIMLDNAIRVDGVILVNENTNSDIFEIVADKLDEVTEAEFR